MSNANTRLSALSPTGEVKWEQLLTSSGQSVAVGRDGTIFVPGSPDFFPVPPDQLTGLRALNPDGTLIWEYFHPHTHAPAISPNGNETLASRL